MADSPSQPLSKNPSMEDGDWRAEPAQRRKAASNFVPSMGNFSIQYNFTSASFAVKFMTDTQYLGRPLYEEPGWADKVTLSAVFVGAMIGMLTMGRLGDVIGRGRAMRCTLALAILGTCIPACAAGSPDLTFAIVCVGRMILGVGVGGIYPLSAAKSAEGSADHASRGRRVSQAFFWQCVGQVAPYLVAMALLAGVKADEPEEWVTQLDFRLLFALGAVPAAVVFIASAREDEAEERHAASVRADTSVWTELRAEPRATFTTLLGTAGSWFLYDVAFYGTNVFEPSILSAICMAGTKDAAGKCSQTLMQSAWQSVIVQMMGIPACLLSIHLVDKIGSKRLNVYGFAILTLLFAAMAIVYQTAQDQSTLLFVLFCALTFFLNFGPNLGTYVLPAVCFPSHIRSTCHGLSAFGGKTGALVGALMFPAIKGASETEGLPIVLWIQAVLCIVAVAVSQVFLKHDWQYLSPEDKLATESFIRGKGSVQDRMSLPPAGQH